MSVVVLVTPSLTYVLFGSLREGVSVTDKASQLPGYLSDTFLHLDFGYAPKFHKPRGQVLLDTMPVDIALLIGSLVCGVAIGLAAGLVGGARRRSAADRALAVGSAIGMSMPVYWFSSIVLVLFAPQSGYLLQVRSCPGTAATSPSPTVRCAGCSRCGCRGSSWLRRWRRWSTG